MRIEQSGDPPPPGEAWTCSDAEIGRISALVLRLCLARGLSRPQAEDVVQDVWLWLLRVRLPGSARSPAWLAAVASNFVLRWRRASMRRRSREEVGLDRVEEPRSLPDFSALEAAEIFERVARALPETERSLLLLIRQGNSLARAAALLKIPRGSRSYHHHRLVELARRELGELPADSLAGRSSPRAKPETTRAAAAVRRRRIERSRVPTIRS